MLFAVVKYYQLWNIFFRSSSYIYTWQELNKEQKIDLSSDGFNFVVKGKIFSKHSQVTKFIVCLLFSFEITEQKNPPSPLFNQIFPCNLGDSPQNFLTFSFDPFVTL